MKLKYNGIEPVNNIFGNWEKGDIKEVPDGTKLIGFDEVKPEAAPNMQPKPIPKQMRKRKVKREKLKDKAERSSAVIVDGD